MRAPSGPLGELRTDAASREERRRGIRRDRRRVGLRHHHREVHRPAPIGASPTYQPRAANISPMSLMPRHAFEVRHQRQPLEPALRREPQLAGDQRMQAVGADHGARAHHSPVRSPPQFGAGHHAVLERQPVERDALAHLGAGRARRVEQQGVERQAGEGVAERPIRCERGAGEPAADRGAVVGDQAEAVQLRGSGGLDRVEHAELLQVASGFGAEILGAGLVAGEPGAVHDDHRQSGTRRAHRGGRAGGSAANHQEVCLRHFSKVEERPPETQGVPRPSRPPVVATAFTASLLSHRHPLSGAPATAHAVGRSLDRRAARSGSATGLETGSKDGVGQHPGAVPPAIIQVAPAGVARPINHAVMPINMALAIPSRRCRRG